MADAVIPIQNPGTTDSNLDSESLTVSAITVKRERMQVTGAAAAEISRVLNAVPAATDYGLVVRPVGQLADNAAFTDGTTAVLPAGFIFDETAGTALTENDVAASRIDSKRALVGVIEDASTRGQRAAVDATGALRTVREATENVSILTSAARTTTQTQADQTNRYYRGIAIVVDVTTAGTGSITMSIDGKDSVSGKYVNLLTGAAITTISTNTYRVYPGLTVAANLVASDALWRTWRVVITHNNANTITYSVGAVLLA